ncbi:MULTISPECIES: RidA family protein [unclassified Beijerinckia]|uniref:RidA family protein n=1 Tax=unclassified Beijerinckia TaxID=2638183 RepID=UPI0008973758|nr:MULTISPECIES: RidA family protein [unclassified Beijerinckia]MDH7797636.1 2-iminobutanoate/2-iminopropanoate deaminase [Beijerinckia sp. GAS462]SEC93139.1 2-iminobutanoate/2-iminopropanoate deaminase [Beijerinckia sp. 28-YEA-48]
MAKRQSIYADGFAHRNPIPAACRMGNLMMSGIINGMDHTKSEPGTLEEQSALMFARIPGVMKAAGGDIGNIVKLNIGVHDISQRAVLNSLWTEMFPDPANRPVRQTTQEVMDGGKLVQCDIVAWID